MQLLHCIALVCGGTGQCSPCIALPHCLGALRSAACAMHCHTAWGQWWVKLPQCTATAVEGGLHQTSRNAWAHQHGGTRSTAKEALTAVKSEIPAMHCHTALGQWAVEFVQCNAELPEGTGQWNSCDARPRILEAVGSATPSIHFHTALGQWAVQLLQCTTSLPVGIGQGNSCNALPHRLGPWTIEILQCAGPTNGGTGSPAKQTVAA